MNPQEEAFRYKLDMLKFELDTVNQIIDRHDKITDNIKYWAIILWAGTISLIMGRSDKALHYFLYFTPTIPFAFAFLDVHWRHLQNRTIFRSNQIAKFLNSDNYLKSFETLELHGFALWDPIGTQYRDRKDYRKFVSMWRILRFQTIWVFYLGLILINLIVAFIANR